MAAREDPAVRERPVDCGFAVSIQAPMPEPSDRDINRLDRLVIAFDRTLRGAARVEPGPTSESPAGDIADDVLDDRERRHSAGLMRVNHAGEVAAQGTLSGSVRW